MTLTRGFPTEAPEPELDEADFDLDCLLRAEEAPIEHVPYGGGWRCDGRRERTMIDPWAPRC
jgi:hypothetical protein